MPILLAELAGVALLAAGGYFGRVWLRRYQLEKRAEELGNEIRHKREDHKIENKDQIYSELKYAEQLAENKEYEKLDEQITTLEDLLD